MAGVLTRSLCALGGVMVVAGTALLTSLPPRTIDGSAIAIGPRQDPRFQTVNSVSGAPSDWVAAVCAPQTRWVNTDGVTFEGFGSVYLFPNREFALQRATLSATCRPRDILTAEPIVIARYQTEAAMEADLARVAIDWYAFGASSGNLIVIATRDAQATTSAGWRISSILEPLEDYGFNIYRSSSP